MTWALLIAAAWLVLGMVVALMVGAAVRLREEREAPSGPRVRVEQRRGQR